MTNTIIHKGGCACGKVRYEVKGNPEVTAVCHCRYCQLRSGSAFGTLVYFCEENFKLVFGQCSSFEFVSESGNSWKNQFCKHCATTLTSRLEVRPNEVGVAGGTAAATQPGWRWSGDQAGPSNQCSHRCPMGTDLRLWLQSLRRAHLVRHPAGLPCWRHTPVAIAP